MKIRFGECEACAVRAKEAEYLKAQVDRLIKEREVERAEYKRAIDALLTRENLPAIGQGSDEHKKPLDMKELLGFMNEPGEDQMETRHPDALIHKVE